MRSTTWLAAITGLAALACGGEAPCPCCDTLVIAAVGEPTSILPPTVMETVGRDIGDQIFERLVDLTPGAAPIDTSAYRHRWMNNHGDILYTDENAYNPQEYEKRPNFEWKKTPARPR